MAAIVNERDKLLQTAAKRIIEIDPPQAIIIEGYTGITLAKDPTMFVINSSRVLGSPSVNPARMTITAALKGIPQNTVVTWETGRNVLITGPGAGGMNTIIGSEFQVGGSTIILTDTPDPFVKLIEASNYPVLPPPNQNFPSGVIRVSVTYGGQVFTATQSVATFTG